jgi:hypothetical protein
MDFQNGFVFMLGMAGVVYFMTRMAISHELKAQRKRDQEEERLRRDEEDDE